MKQNLKYLACLIFMIFLQGTGFSLLAQQSSKTLLNTGTLPNGIGVQLKNKRYTNQDLDKIKELGLTWVRHGFIWSSVEKVKGEYDFSYYDEAVRNITEKGLNIVGCIAFSNQLYGAHAKDEPGRTGYANFAAALVARYKDYNIVWEIWNEPNTMTFWGRHGGVGNSELYASEYVGLVKAAVPAMKKADPDCIIFGGAVSNMWIESYKWMSYCFRDGLLATGIDVLSVHPYGLKAPEDYVFAYDTTRTLMLNAGGPVLPLFDTERGFPLGENEGYAGGDSEHSKEYQAWHIVRQYLIDRYLGVIGTIWYEWSGTDNEINFSLFSKDEELPVYTATKVMIDQLSGYTFEKRIELNNPRDFVLMFLNKNGKRKLVAWTSPPPMETVDKTRPHEVTIPVDQNGTYQLVDIYGKESKKTSGNLRLMLTGSPKYILLNNK